jgi:hypothetical protein
MAFGFPYPHCAARRTFKVPQDELFETVKVALKDLGWSYKILWGKEFEGQIPTTNWSWHHDFKVRFPTNGVMEVESRSAYQEMLFDFGRNKRNVERFFACVEQRIAQVPRDNA